MRFLRCKSTSCVDVQEALSDFMELAEDHGFAAESDLVSVSVNSPPDGAPAIFRPRRESVKPLFYVTVVYWSEDRE